MNKLISASHYLFIFIVSTVHLMTRRESVYWSSDPSLGFDLAMNKHLMSLCSGLPMGSPRLPLLQWPSDRVQDAFKKLQQDIGPFPK